MGFLAATPISFTCSFILFLNHLPPVYCVLLYFFFPLCQVSFFHLPTPCFIIHVLSPLFFSEPPGWHVSAFYCTLLLMLLFVCLLVVFSHRGPPAPWGSGSRSCLSGTVSSRPGSLKGDPTASGWQVSSTRRASWQPWDRYARHQATYHLPTARERPDGTQREKQAHSHIYTRMQTCTDKHIHRDLQVVVVIFLQCMKFILHSDNMLNLSLNPIPVVNSAGTSMVNGNFCMKLPFLVFLSDHFYLLVPFVCSDLANTGRLAESGNSFMGKQHLYYTCTLLLPPVVPILHHKYMTANVCLKFSGKVRADGIFNLKRFWMLNNLFSKSSDLSVLKGCNVQFNSIVFI